MFNPSLYFNFGCTGKGCDTISVTYQLAYVHVSFVLDGQTYEYDVPKVGVIGGKNHYSLLLSPGNGINIVWQQYDLYWSIEVRIEVNGPYGFFYINPSNTEYPSFSSWTYFSGSEVSSITTSFNEPVTVSVDALPFLVHGKKAYSLPEFSLSIVWDWSLLWRFGTEDIFQATLSSNTPCPFGVFTIEEGSIFESFEVSQYTEHLEITINSNEYSFTLLGDSIDINIDWGDGTIENITGNTPYHLYDSTGTYSIKIKGNLGGNGKIYFGLIDDGGDYMNEYGSRVIGTSQIRGIHGLESFERLFAYCNLSSIPENLFYKYPTVINFDQCFLGCQNLLSIPEDLFRFNTGATRFNYTFSSCTNITTLPENIFQYNTNIQTLIGTFFGLAIESIPVDLFKNNINITSFDSTFQNCQSLLSIPEDLFIHNVNVQLFGSCFSFCNSIQSIPENLFVSNINAENFNATFQNCPLLSIPEDLFKNNIAAKYFDACFYNVNITEIPANLFMNNINAESFVATFIHCQNLSIIPPDLFKENTQVINMRAVFNSCSSLTIIPVDLFRHNTEVINMSGVFIDCSSLTTIPPDLFRYNINCTTFEESFFHCRNLTMVSDIFGPDLSTRFLDKSINFRNFFFLNSWLGVQGTAPEIWNANYGSGTPTTIDCFQGHSVSSLSNNNSIPSGWR
jgi:hypothetical protein